MKIGTVFPQIELGGDPEAIDRFGRTTETLGYDHLLMYDHVVGAVHENRNPPLWAGGPYTDKDPFHDPLVSFGYLAAATKRIEFVTGVLILPQRQTVLVAKQATDVDLLSGGRLRLGVGAGWNYVEYDALGQDFQTRGQRLSEQITYLRPLWSEPLLTFEGKFDRIDRASILPRPKRRIPIYCGGFSEPAFKRAAKLADGFIFATSFEHASSSWQRVRELLAAEGRAVDGFVAHYLMQDNVGRGLNADAMLDVLRRWQDVGGTHASVVTMGRDFKSTQQHLDHITEVSHKVLKQ
jgi:probable F420-dependent oxidoreductase